MSRSVAAKHFSAALGRWPKDPLRPERQLQDVLSKRLETGEGVDLRQANALYSLLDNRYKHRYRITEDFMLKPKSKPTYYDDLIKDLDAAPTRTVWHRLMMRISGMFRLQ
ncbi:uncharacterized protein PpBr36_06615 [Pyricularia pennisetigena]|uniref:uncharacterized protein n=1 Tax=Pyricularia pennisetigena TaxID=1578925 RepID=UPI00114FCB4A|nr:uncharacterized protein PpBr36_06615 [Pyricularia pennisetigena]TLS23087.1 hypothetical protein PpBr36_06615 [Pyricularia pennisetigena]